MAAPLPAAATITVSIDNNNNATTVLEGTGPAFFEITLSEPTPAAVTIHYKVKYTIRLDDGSLPEDYTEGSETFEIGDDIKPFGVRVYDNNRLESCTNIIVLLSGVSFPAGIDDYGNQYFQFNSAKRFASVKVQDDEAAAMDYIIPSNCR